MFIEYIDEALAKAKYELLSDENEYYGEIPECKGVWSTGKTIEECRSALKDVLEGWILMKIKKGLEVPILNGKTIRPLGVAYEQIEASQMA